jgi:hypothetical protein
LALAEHRDLLIASNRLGDSPEVLEAQTRLDEPFDVLVILLDDVIQELTWGSLVKRQSSPARFIALHVAVPLGSDLGPGSAAMGKWVVGRNCRIRVQWFAQFGMRMSANSHIVIRSANAWFVLAGMTDLAAGNTGFPSSNIAKATEGIPAEALVILFNH